MGFAGVGMLENVQAFGVRGHQAVLDAVVDHFDEVAGAGRAAVKIAFFRSAANPFASRSAIGIATSWRECFENRIQALDDFSFAADHLAVAAFEAPNASARAYVAIMNAFRREFFGAADVVDVLGISPVNDDVLLLQ